MAVVKGRGPGISQSEKGVEPGPARADRRYEVECGLSTILEPDWVGALWSGRVLEEAVDVFWLQS